MQVHSNLFQFSISLSIVFLLFNPSNIWGQTTKDQDSTTTETLKEYPNCYYLLSAKADHLRIQEKNYEGSATLYQQAFRLVPKALVNDYYGASITHALLKNRKLAIKYLEEAIRLGLGWGAIQYHKATWLDLVGTEEYESLKLKHEVLRREFYQNLDLSTYTALMKMDANAQYIRGQVNKKMNRPFTHEITVDSINTEKTKKLIKEEGFPNLQKIGADCMFNLIGIILHACQKNEQSWAYFEPILKVEMKKGNIRPGDYAVIADSHHYKWHNKKSLYGSYISKRGVSPISNIAEIDNRRLSIGLPPLKYALDRFGLSELPTGYEWNEKDYWSECQ